MKGAAILLALLLAPTAPQVTTGSVLAGIRNRVETADYRITGRIVRVDADGRRHNYNVTVKAHWFPGVLRILMDVTQPAPARERILFEMQPSGESEILLARPGDLGPEPCHSRNGQRAF